MIDRLDDDGALRNAFGQMAAKDLANVPPAPDPRYLWLKAEFAARQKRHSLIGYVSIAAYSALAVAISVMVYVVSKQDTPVLPAVSVPELTPSVALPVVVAVLVAMILFVPSRTQPRS